MKPRTDFLLPILPFILLGSLMLLLKCSTIAPTRELYSGQYAQVDPHVREWFQRQKSPGSGVPCCNQSDGTLAEEDIRGTHYWTRWPGQDWMQVPEETVINNTGNPNGSAVVWWWHENGEVRIRCFVPGGGV